MFALFFVSCQQEVIVEQECVQVLPSMPIRLASHSSKDIPSMHKRSLRLGEIQLDDFPSTEHQRFSKIPQLDFRFGRLDPGLQGDQECFRMMILMVVTHLTAFQHILQDCPDRRQFFLIRMIFGCDRQNRFKQEQSPGQPGHRSR